VENPLDQKLDLSALHLGNISLGTLLGTLLTLVICLVAVRLLTALLRRVLAQTHMDARVQKYLVRTVQLVLWVVTVLITADQLGIPVTSLVALLSVLSLAVSLAVQNVLANVAGGLVLLVTKPFAVGDYVDTPCGAGTVKELTLTYTYLDTPDGLRIAAPNSSLSAGKITNYTTLGTRRIQHSVSASYDAPVQTVRQALLDAVARTPGLLESPGPEVYVNAYGESGIEYIVRSWARTADYWTAYYALLENIKAAFDERAVEMPYNHLNVHIVDPVRVERETKA
jgi:small conductance mechanosensitive channel